MRKVANIRDYQEIPEYLAARKLWDSLDDDQRQGIQHGLIPLELIVKAGRGLDQDKIVQELIGIANGL